jgi:rhomboid protease GluP
MYWQDGSNVVLYRMGANSGDEVRAGEVWRVLASAFLHGNVAHLLVNMIALAALGPVLERLLGPQRYLILYALSALGGGLASALLRGPGIAVGASGAIWGLMAAGLGLALRPRGLLPPLRLDYVRRRAAIPLVINLLYSFTPGIDLHAHIGGGAVGIALMLTGVITRGVDPVWTEASDAPPRKRPSAVVTGGALVLAIALIGSVVMALAEGRPWQVNQPPVLARVQLADTGVSLELPEALALSLIEKNKAGTRTFSFVNFNSAHVGVDAMMVVHPDPVPPEQLDEIMKMMRRSRPSAAIPS